MSKYPIRVDFYDLVSEIYYDGVERLVEDAFGLNGFGAVIVTNIPNFKEIRQKTLENMYKLSQEPQKALDALVQPNKNSLYEVGWHTKKMNSAFGKSSNRFVSFFSRYPKETVNFPRDKKFEEENINIWTTTVKNFKEDLLLLNQNLMPPVLGLLKYIDGYLSKNIKDYPDNKFVNSFSKNYSNANRLIVYTPLDEFNLNEEDQYNWDNWHTDFGLLATATHPIYMTKSGKIYDLNYSCYALKDRHGNEHEVKFSEDEFLITSYTGHNFKEKGKVFTAKTKKALSTDDKKMQKWRSAIEPIIGHLKNFGRMCRNYLKGIIGDIVNPLISAVGLNLRRIANILKESTA